MPLNVMIIDQSCLIRKQLRENLCDYSDICVMFDSGKINDALTYQRIWMIDVAVIDVTTCHGALGYSVAALKRMNPALYVIALTDQSDVVYNSFTHSLGVDLSIDKAAEFMRLPAAVLASAQGNTRFLDEVERSAQR